jgi:hypothetical protein
VNPVQSTAKIPQPTTALREHEKLTPHRAGIATLHGPDRRRNRDWKAPRIRPGSRPRSPDQSEDRRLLTPGIRNRIGNPQTARPRLTPGAANTQTQLKKKLSEHPGNPSTYPPTLTRSRIARPGRPETPAADILLGGQIGESCTAGSLLFTLLRLRVRVRLANNGSIGSG